MKTVYFEDIVEGSVVWDGECNAEREEMIAYARKNDPWPFHIDEEAAKGTPFGGLIASGGYTISLMYRLGHEGAKKSGEAWAFLGGFDWHVKFQRPVRPGDRLRRRTTVLSKRPSSKPGRGVVTILVEMINQNDQVALSVTIAFLVEARPTPI